MAGNLDRAECPMRKETRSGTVLRRIGHAPAMTLFTRATRKHLLALNPILWALKQYRRPASIGQ